MRLRLHPAVPRDKRWTLNGMTVHIYACKTCWEDYQYGLTAVPAKAGPRYKSWGVDPRRFSGADPYQADLACRHCGRYNCEHPL